MDLAAQIASLKNDFGASKGPNAAAAFAVELWIGSPDGGGQEMPTTTVLTDDDGVETTVANGYAPAPLTNNGTNFPVPDADSGILETPLVAGFPTSTAAYPAAVTHWVLRDTATGAIWHAAAFPADQRITVGAAGVKPVPVLSIFYNPITDLTGD